MKPFIKERNYLVFNFLVLSLGNLEHFSKIYVKAPTLKLKINLSWKCSSLVKEAILASQNLSVLKLGIEIFLYFYFYSYFYNTFIFQIIFWIFYLFKAILLNCKFSRLNWKVSRKILYCIYVRYLLMHALAGIRLPKFLGFS